MAPACAVDDLSDRTMPSWDRTRRDDPAERLTISVPGRGELEGEEARGKGGQSGCGLGN